MKLKILIAIGLFAAAVSAQARDTIQIVGSSTVYPFATVVAERFGKSTSFKTPVVESTGSGGGLKLFCKGTGVDAPDITNSSRRIKQSELDKCKANGVTDVVEVKVGYDGIVIANANSAPVFKLSLRDIYLALARDVPNPDGSETFVPNPYTHWNQINADLPELKIEVLGPPPTSGTRDAFVELAMEGGAKTFDWVKALKKTDKKVYKARAHTIREDGHFVEAGENDNLIVQKLSSNPSALGIFGFSFLDQNSDSVKGAEVDGVSPEFEAIASGDYPVSRPLYFYVKKAHAGKIPGLREFVKMFASDGVWGDDGILTDKGLIPMPADERKFFGEQANTLSPLTTLQ